MRNKPNFMAYLRGYLRVRIRGGRFEELINRMTVDRYGMWEIAKVDRETAVMVLAIPDFFRLRPLLRETGCRIHVLERKGFPFLLERLGRRKLFAAGILFFVIGLYVLSSMIWEVRVEGNKQIPTEDVLAAAEALHIHPFQWKFRLPDTSRLSSELERALPDATWVGVTIRGTVLNIQVVEAKKPGKAELTGPRNLVADTDAVVTDMFVEKGKPMVKPNMSVRKGDVLVSGWIGSEENAAAVAAKGTVRGLVWHEYRVKVPMTEKWRTLTGRTKVSSYLLFGNLGLKISGFGSPQFVKSEDQLLAEKEIAWRGVTLPLGWMKVKEAEIEFTEHHLTQAEAVRLGIQQAEHELLLKNALDAKVMKTQVLHQAVENGDLQMTVLVESDEIISVEQPIVQTAP